MRVTDTFDFVVVGGGSGGCTVAGRLSEDPNISVAVLDAGGKNDNWVVTTPFALVLMVAGNVNNWAFNTVPQKGLNGRIGYQPRGKGLGGSSAINAMVYIRGHRADYDQWASLGNAGWSFADVLPYFKRAETTPISTANITARAARSPSTSRAPAIRCSRSSCRPRRKRSSACARISMPTSMRASASIN
jgi:choline dehydrogenase-like flavoprotein